MKSTNLIFFPFLKTSKSFSLRGLEFHSTGDLSSFEEEQKQLIKKVSKLFYMRDNYQIDKMTFCLIHTDDSKDGVVILKETISEIQQILGYVYSSPHPTFLDSFLKYESATFYHVIPKMVSYFLVTQDFNVSYKGRSLKKILRNERGEVDGYSIDINENISMSAIDGCRVYPTPPHIILNISQDIAFDLNQFVEVYPIFKFLFQKRKFDNSRVENKIFNALKWYNRSNSMLSDSNETILKLAVAFETLLDLPNEPKLKDRFKDAVKVLVGPVNNLESWITQFYEARSEIVHSGTTSKYRMNFEKGNIYHSLSAYGNVIFRICLFAIIAGAEMANRSNLSTLFKTNRQRFSEICKLLNKRDQSYKETFTQVNREIFNLDNYKFVYEENLEFRIMIGAVKSYSKIILEIDVIKTNEIEILLTDFQNINGSDKDFENLDKLKEINEYIKHHIIELENGEGYWVAFKSLVDTVWHYTFRNYFYLKNKR